jgi:hypothetical protein
MQAQGGWHGNSKGLLGRRGAAIRPWLLTTGSFDKSKSFLNFYRWSIVSSVNAVSTSIELNARFQLKLKDFALAGVNSDIFISIVCASRIFLLRTKLSVSPLDVVSVHVGNRKENFTI